MKMYVKFKYITLFLSVIMHVSTNSGHVTSKYKNSVTSGDVRIKRQAGYVYDKPTVSFDLPTATSIATTQAPTVDRIQMQMYYAYPVPAAGADSTINVAQQTTGSSASAGATAAVSSTGYKYEVQNTQVTDSRSTLTETQNTVSSGYQNTAVTGTQAVISSGSAGYGDGKPTSLSTSGSTGAFISSGSAGYGDGRPTSVSTSSSTGESMSTSAPGYLPPQNSDDNTAAVSVTSNQAQTGLTITQTSYIPPTAQVSSPQNDQRVTITRSGSNAQSPSANPNTGYILPNPQPAPKGSVQPGPVQSVQSMPAQEYLPPIETSAGQKTIQGSVAAPAPTYLPPVF